MADQSVLASAERMNTAKPATRSETTTTSTSKPYVPAVGDEVEFECSPCGDDKSTCKGIVFDFSEMGQLCIVSNFNGSCYAWNLAITRSQTNVRKVGYAESVPHEPIDFEEIGEIAKAYFASKPAFKVGDRVKVVSNSLGARNSLVGETVEVVSVGKKTITIKSDIDGRWGMGIGDIVPLSELATFTPDPDKSYAENQAAWCKFYGVTNSSQVKILRLAEKGEGDWNGLCAVSDTSLIGEIVPISLLYAGSDGISLGGRGSACHLPYFCLEPVQE